MRLKYILSLLLIELAAITFPNKVSADCHNNFMHKTDTVEVIMARDTMKRIGLVKRVIKYFSESNKKSTKKFDISFIGGPNYSSDTKLGVGIVAAGLYRTTPDTLTSISNISIFSNITVSGYYSLGIRGNTFFDSDRWRIDYLAKFISFPTDTWGFGYMENNINSNKSSYLRIQTLVKADLLYRIFKNTYAGATVRFDFIKGSKYKSDRYDLITKAARGYSLGAVLVYDSRDFIPNPYRGSFIKLTQDNFTTFTGRPFFRTTLIADKYCKIAKNTILAFDLYTEFNYGTTPWQMYSQLGGSYRMRGYYEGRYNDNNMIELQMELRQKIYNRHGIAVWIGAGNVYGDCNSFSWKHTLPNAGIGYRWEFKKRMNIRLDYGIGKNGQSGFMFGVEEAF
jgi:outer membrane protein assembly factor BamA